MMTPPLRSFSKAQIARALALLRPLRADWTPDRRTVMNADGCRAVADQYFRHETPKPDATPNESRVLPLKKKNAG